MKRIIQGFVLAVVGACTVCASERWLPSELIGYSLTIVSKTTVQAYWFTERGDALAEFGRKDGAVTGTVVSWQIDADGILRITLDERKVAALKKVKVTGSRYLVEDSGVQREYLRKDWTEYQASHPKNKK